MKKIYSVLILLFVAVWANAQTLLDEDFEINTTSTVASPIATGEGWTTVNSYTGTAHTGYNWGNYYSEKGTIGGKHCAYCDGPTYDDSTGDGQGPREEILLTPELKLDDTYQLSFDWEVSPMAAYQNSLYDLQVRIVVNGDIKNAETIFSIQNKEDMKESGVTEFPVSTWDAHTSKLDLSEWKGQSIKIAFVYKMYTTIANIVFLDNVSVKKFTPITTPLASIDNDSYNFGDVYVGEKFYTTIFNLKNIGKKGLKITGVELPNGVAINRDYTTVDLDILETFQFQLSYSASLLSPAKGNAIIHTNGGDISIALSATKKVVPEGATLETFEKYFPPAGWTNDGWKGVATALEGDCSAYATGSYSDQILTSPRLDLTNGGTLAFTYYNRFSSEDGSSYQNNDFSVELSGDGGNTWTQMWLYNYEDTEKQETKTFDLGSWIEKLAADETKTIDKTNCYVRWINTAVTADDEGALEFSDIYLDRILLPTLYGANDIPGTTTLSAPKDSLTEVYPKNVVLSWGPAQFAQGYKLYMGSNESADNFINGLDLGDVLTYTVAKCDYETTYSWKIVPYNKMGDNNNVPVWHFTTQKDASTAAYPYAEDFSGKKLPTGWTCQTNSQYSRKWSVNDNYGNAAPCLYISWMYNGENSAVTTQEFKLPADKSMAVSFDWGDGHPSDMLVDETGLQKKQNVSPNNGIGKTTFEVLADGEWHELSWLSENPIDKDDHKYWRRENIDLSQYAGKTVQLRWTNYSYSGKHDGACLDNVLIEAIEGDKATFNKASWVAGKVNYQKAVNSGEQFTILNKGVKVLKVSSVTFKNANFSSSLKAGDEIAVGDGKVFSLQFNAGDTNAALKDTMTVTFESGYKALFPVSAEALAEDVRYYAFEQNDLDLKWREHWTLIDADGQSTYSLTSKYWTWTKFGQKYAFTEADDSQMNYVMGPVSGSGALVAAAQGSSSSTTADDWIISEQILVNSNSRFDFYARNWESNQSIMPDSKHRISVLVSTKGNTNTEDFEVVLKEQEIPFLDGKDWQFYSVDLSKYAGQNIYVALRHTTNGESNLSFYDDFSLVHVGNAAAGITNVYADDAQENTVYDLTGRKVMNAGRGIFIINGKKIIKK